MSDEEKIQIAALGLLGLFSRKPKSSEARQEAEREAARKQKEREAREAREAERLKAEREAQEAREKAERKRKEQEEREAREAQEEAAREAEREAERRQKEEADRKRKEEAERQFADDDGSRAVVDPKDVNAFLGGNDDDAMTDEPSEPLLSPKNQTKKQTNVPPVPAVSYTHLTLPTKA